MNTPLLNPVFKDLPIKVKNNVDMTRLYDCNTFKVAVQYCVLRPKSKKHT